MIAALPFEQPFPSGSILVPPVRLESGSLYYQPNGPLHPARGQRDRLVYDFAGLGDAPAAAILRFARVWGVLGLCGHHRKPMHHQNPACPPQRVGDEFVEPIAKWRSRARYVRSILNIKAELNRDHPGSSADWKVVWPGPAPKDRTLGVKTLAKVASIFVSQNDVQPILECVNDRLAITFIGGNLASLLKSMAAADGISSWLSSSATLLAEIAIRTMLALEEGAGWTTCSNPECGRLYRPPRNVAEGRLHFCGDCGKRASWRLSKRRSAARKIPKLTG
jgi:hypothetical protein